MFAMIQLTFCRTTKMKVEQPKTCRYWNRKYTCKHWTKILSPVLGEKPDFPHTCDGGGYRESDIFVLRSCVFAWSWRRMPNKHRVLDRRHRHWHFIFGHVLHFWWFFTQPFVVSRFLFSFLEPQQLLVSKNPSILSESKIVDHRCSGRLELWMANLRIGRILDSENLNLKRVGT